MVVLRVGAEHGTRLEPQSGDPRCCHPEKKDAKH